MLFKLFLMLTFESIFLTRTLARPVTKEAVQVITANTAAKEPPRVYRAHNAQAATTYVANGTGWRVHKLYVANAWLKNTEWAVCYATCVYPAGMTLTMKRNGVPVVTSSVWQNGLGLDRVSKFSRTCPWSFDLYVKTVKGYGGAFECTLARGNTALYTSPKVELKPYGFRLADDPPPKLTKLPKALALCSTNHTENCQEPAPRITPLRAMPF